MISIYFNDRVLIISKPGKNQVYSKDLVSVFNPENSLEDFVLDFEQKKDCPVAFIEDEEPQTVLKKICDSFKYIEAAGGLVLKPTDEFLVIERLGVWDLPKGKIEKGEDPLTGAIREIEEECGITGIEMVTPLAPTYHTYRMKGKFIVKKTFWHEFYYDGTESPSPQEEEDITFAGFLPESRIPEILAKTYPSIIDVFEEVFS